MAWRGAIGHRLQREAVAVLVAVTVLAVVLMPHGASSLTALFGLVLGTPLLWALRTRAVAHLGRPAAAALVATAIAALVPAIATLGAMDARISWFGRLGQHNGALTWIAAATLFCAIVVFGLPGDAGRAARAIAIAGAVLAAGGLLDAVGIIPDVHYSQEAAGFLESSLLLAQTMLVAVGCAVAWAVTRKGGERVAAWACAAACLAGLAVASSRAAWTGLGVAAVAAGAYWAVSRRRALSPTVSAGICVALLIVSLGAAWLLTVAPASAARDRLVAASNDRATIWRSAFVQAGQHLWTGKGPEQFTAWSSALAGPEGLTLTSTADAHNIVIAWLVAAGIPGLLAPLAAAFTGLRAGFAALTAHDLHPGLLAMAAGTFALGVALLFAWTSPLAAMFAVLSAGTLVASVPAGAGEVLRLDGPWLPAVLAVVCAGMIAVAGMSWKAAAGEVRWASAWRGGTVDPEVIARDAVAAEDPVLASFGSEGLVTAAYGSSTEATALLAAADPLRPLLAAAAPWSADAAYDLEELEVARGRVLRQDRWREIEGALERGKKADPASGVWDYVAARRASDLGKPEAARSHARAALGYPQPEAIMTWLRTTASAPD